MENKRFKQANREALITLGVYGFFFLWWTVFAFVLGSGDPDLYSYVFGMPAWFFYSCVLGYPIISVLLWIIIKCTFTDMPLDALDRTEQEEHTPALLQKTSAKAASTDGQHEEKS